MKYLLEEYAKHYALNFGQALQGIRYFFSHSDMDGSAPRDSIKHAFLSAGLRLKRIVNDIFFPIIPPHWHHTKVELSSMTKVPIARWFQYGYCAWRFEESGQLKVDLADVDKRWDPRCQSSKP
jgi:hypothetical protein